MTQPTTRSLADALKERQLAMNALHRAIDETQRTDEVGDLEGNQLAREHQRRCLDRYSLRNREVTKLAGREQP